MEAKNRKTLAWLIVDTNWIGKPHPMWLACRGKPFQIKAANIRALLLTGRYSLQANRVLFTKQDSDPLCPLCGREEEDVIHFTTRCMANSGTIGDGVVDLQEMYSDDRQDPPLTPMEVCSAILNGWGYRTDPGTVPNPGPACALVGDGWRVRELNTLIG